MWTREYSAHVCMCVWYECAVCVIYVCANENEYFEMLLSPTYVSTFRLRLPCCNVRGEHGEELARTELCRAPALEARQRLRGDAGLCGNGGLPQPQAAAAHCDGFTQVFERLHLIFMSRC